MCNIVVIFSLFCIFARLRNVSAGKETQDPYVLAEYDDKDRRKNHHYEVPTCAAEGKSKYETLYSASGESFRILYACYPVTVNECAMESGNFRNNYCLFDEKPKCGVEGSYEYVIKYVVNSRGYKTGCAKKQDDTEFFRVGYDFKFTKGDSANVDIYRFCYNKTTNKTLYAEYKIISPNLLDTNVDNRMYQKEIETTSFDRVDLGDFAKKKAYYEKIKTDPEYKSRVPSLLVPPQHMALDWWKAPLFHIVNQQLLREEVYTRLNFINDHIRDKAKDGMGEIFIRAGVFDLADDLFHSFIWWKLIYNEKRTHAIGLIIHNESIAPYQKLCGDELFCNNNGWGGLVPANKGNFIYCCSPDYIVNYFNFESVETLDLKNLAEEAYLGEKKDCKIPIPYKAGSQNGDQSGKQKFGGFLSTMLEKQN